MPKSWPRFLLRFSLALLAALALLDLGLAAALTFGLTQPPCLAPNLLPADLPAPQIHHFNSADGNSLEAWYYPSKNGATVVALGGMQGALGENLPHVEPLLRAGYGVFQISSRACAQPTALITLGYAEAFDAIAALEFLLEQPEVDSERIGLFGFSMGGAAAIRAAAMDERFAAVLAEGGYANLGQHLASAGDSESKLMSLLMRSTIQLLDWRIQADPWELSPIDDIEKISPRSLFLIYSEASSLSGRAQDQFEAASEPKELWVVPESTHGGTQLVAPEEYEQRVLQFFAGVLLAGD